MPPLLDVHVWNSNFESHQLHLGAFATHHICSLQAFCTSSTLWIQIQLGLEDDKLGTLRRFSSCIGFDLHLPFQSTFVVVEALGAADSRLDHHTIEVSEGKAQ